MARQWQTLTFGNFSGGIDAKSSIDQIPDSFCEDLVNMDVNANGSLEKRKGFIGVGGYLPIRATSMEQDSTRITLTVDSAIDTTAFANRPILVKGILSTGGTATSDLTSIEERSEVVDGWYPGIWIYGGNVVQPLVATGTDLTTSHVLAKSILTTFGDDSWTSNTNTYIINTTSLLLTSTSTGTLANGWTRTYFKQYDAASISSYVAEKALTAGAESAISLLSTSFSYGKWLVQLLRDEPAGTWTSAVNLTQLRHTHNQLLVTVGTSDTYKAIVIGIPDSQTKTATIAAGATTAVTLTGVTSPYLFYQAWEEVGGYSYLYSIDSASYDPNLQSLIITVTNSTGADKTIHFVYDYGDVRSNQIQWEPLQVTTTYTDPAPSVCVYGLEHKDGIGIDAITRDKNDCLVAAQGGSLFQEIKATSPVFTYKAAGSNIELYQSCTLKPGDLVVASNSTGASPLVDGTTYYVISSTTSFGALSKITLGLSLNTTISVTGTGTLTPVSTNNAQHLGLVTYQNHVSVSTAQYLSPYFVGVGETTTRTPGCVFGTNVVNNTIPITGATYNSGTGYVDYVARIEGYVQHGTFATSLFMVEGYEDRLTVTECPHGVLNGEFRIRAISLTAIGGGVYTITFSCVNDEIATTDFDMTAAFVGTAGIYTQAITGINGTPLVLDGDELLITGQKDVLTAIASRLSNTYIHAKDVTEAIVIPAGATINIRRTQDFFVGNTSGGPKNGVMSGDTVTLDGTSGEVHITARQAATSTYSGTLLGGITPLTVEYDGSVKWEIGDRVIIVEAGMFGGEYSVVEALGDRQYELNSETIPIIDTSCRIIHPVFTLDRAVEMEYTKAGLSMSPVSRWIPISVPSTNTPVSRHLAQNAYNSQPIVRMQQQQDSIYVAAESNPIWKYDGTNAYRASLPRWQPLTFCRVETTGGISVQEYTDNTTDSGSVFTITGDVTGKWAAGDIVYYNDGAGFTAYYELAKVVYDSANTQLTVLGAVIGGDHTGSIAKVTKYRYAARMQVIDRNNRVMSTAYAGISDQNVYLTEDSNIHFRLTGFPKFDVYDYARMEVVLLRTKANTPGPYFIVYTKQVSPSDCGYIDMVDKVSDSALTDLDATASAIMSGLGFSAAELPTTLDEPARAKYVTTSGNRLVLANYKSWPRWDIRFRDPGNRSLVASDFVDGSVVIKKTVTATTPMIDKLTYRFTNKRPQKTSGGAGDAVITGTVTNASTFVITHNTHTGGANPLAAGDWIYIFRISTSEVLTTAGWWQVASVGGSDDAWTATISYPGLGGVGGALANDAMAFTYAAAEGAYANSEIPVYVGTDLNYAQFGYDLAYPENVVALKLAQAVNASQRICTTTGFVPWLKADAGFDYNAGQIILTAPTSTVTPILTISTAPTTAAIFVNNLLYALGVANTADIKSFPSRLLLAAPNFAEVFDAPLEAQINSASVMDINESDGQEIISVDNMLGEAAFSGSMVDSPIVVFKTASIYLADPVSKQYIKLDTGAVGCTVPLSVASSKNGLFFVSSSGIYRIGRDRQIQPVGSLIQDKFDKLVDINLLSVATGTYWPLRQKYVFAFTDINGDDNGFVYDTLGDSTERRMGAWSRYEGLAATCFYSFGDDMWFGTKEGLVNRMRRTGEAHDYQDNGKAISCEATLKAMNFGMAGTRKVAANVISHFVVENGSAMTGTQLQVSADFSDVFASTIDFTVDTLIDGLSDLGQAKAVAVRSSLPRPKFLYLQMKYTNDAINEPMKLTGVDVVLTPLTRKGIKEAAKY